jgi:hypothetical protein
MEDQFMENILHWREKHTKRNQAPKSHMGFKHTISVLRGRLRLSGDMNQQGSRQNSYRFSFNRHDTGLRIIAVSATKYGCLQV